MVALLETRQAIRQGSEIGEVDRLEITLRWMTEKTISIWFSQRRMHG